MGRCNVENLQTTKVELAQGQQKATKKQANETTFIHSFFHLAKETHNAMDTVNVNYHSVDNAKPPKCNWMQVGIAVTVVTLVAALAIAVTALVLVEKKPGNSRGLMYGYPSGKPCDQSPSFNWTVIEGSTEKDEGFFCPPYWDSCELGPGFYIVEGRMAVQFAEIGSQATLSIYPYSHPLGVTVTGNSTDDIQVATISYVYNFGATHFNLGAYISCSYSNHPPQILQQSWIIVHKAA